jgi:hypothetical protein
VWPTSQCDIILVLVDAVLPDVERIARRIENLLPT